MGQLLVVVVVVVVAAGTTGGGGIGWLLMVVVVAVVNAVAGGIGWLLMVRCRRKIIARMQRRWSRSTAGTTLKERKGRRETNHG